MTKEKKDLRNGLQDYVAGLLMGVVIASTPLIALSIRNILQAVGDTPYKTILRTGQDIEIEKKQLGLEGVSVNVTIQPQSLFSLLIEMRTAYTKRENNGSYSIVLREGEGRTVLRHELWHVYQLETRPRSIGFGKFFDEWEAQNYIDGY